MSKINPLGLFYIGFVIMSGVYFYYFIMFAADYWENEYTAGILLLIGSLIFIGSAGLTMRFRLAFKISDLNREIADVNLQIEELMERLDDVDGIVNHVKLSVNPRYIGQDTSRPSAPEAQDDGRDAEDHAA